MKNKTIALAGNPNVGKSTVFNALTGMHQHTGNWPGKTVTNAAGNMKYKDATFDFIDLPGAYSLDSLSPDEAVTGEYIRSGKADIILIVADATCLERNLLLVKDILDITHDAVLCVNLMDEARKKGIIPDIGKLQELLRIPVIPASARSEEGLDELIEVLYSFAPGSFASERPADSSHPVDISSIYRQCVSFRKKEPCSFDISRVTIIPSSMKPVRTAPAASVRTGEAAGMKKIRIMAIRVGNLPLQGTKLLVSMAMRRSLGDSMIRQPVTPQALHPKPMHIVSDCFP